MKAGAAKIEITPTDNVWMDGMIRTHPSQGVHDPLHARCLALSVGHDLSEACVIVSVEIVSLSERDADLIRHTVAERRGIPRERIVLAATHTHSGPATIGVFNPQAIEYVADLRGKLVHVIEEALDNLQPADIGSASGSETTISHYRRLLADDGKVVMNWEPVPPERIVRPLGEIDPEVGVLKVTDAADPQQPICILFNHAGHPNVLSGDNYHISADYPGYAARLLETEYDCVAMFVNGAQGTMDVDGLRDRDWQGVVRVGTALATATSEVVDRISPVADPYINSCAATYHLEKRKIGAEELRWAEQLLETTGGSVQSMADGVGEDYKAKLYKQIYDAPHTHVEIEQICVVVGDTAMISFPGELFTEIGMQIKSRSPFRHTYLIGLANGKIGYIPTRKAISEGGYAVDTRRLDVNAEDVIVAQSLALLRNAREAKER